MTSTSPRIERVFLRASTAYRVLQGDGMSEPRTLARATEVAVVYLALNPRECGVYMLLDGGDHIFVRFEDEVRGQEG